jgi:hypothetical protein
MYAALYGCQIRAHVVRYPQMSFTKFGISDWLLILSIVIISTFHKELWGGGASVGAVGRGTALQAGRSRVRFPMVSLDFFIDIFLPAALWSWVWLSLWHKWVPGMFSGGKGGRCVVLTNLPPSCTDYLEIWEPQPPGTLKACPGL